MFAIQQVYFVAKQINAQDPLLLANLIYFFNFY